MAHFRTEIEISKPTKPIGYANKMMFMGSCFAESIGEKFSEARFNVNINPFGIVYNPISIAQSLETMMGHEKFNDDELLFHNGLWQSLDHHGRFSSPDKAWTLAQINDAIDEGSSFLKDADILCITFGSASVYEHIQLSRVVANCHKLPSSTFNRYRLNVDEIVELYKTLIIKILVFNPRLRFIFTVSPVRHWKDGAHGNQLTKSVLLLAIDQLENLFEQVDYFPSYELLLDDLRDYRFYADDLLHPNKLAIDYIWEKLVAAWFNDQAKQFCADTTPLVKARHHRPLFPNTLEYKAFVEKMLQRVNALSEKYPDANFIDDRQFFQGVIGS